MTTYTTTKETQTRLDPAPTPRHRPSSPTPDDETLLAAVPHADRAVVRAALNSRQPSDFEDMKRCAARYGLDYATIRRHWGVEPIGDEIEVVGKDGVVRRASI